MQTIRLAVIDDIPVLNKLDQIATCDEKRVALIKRAVEASQCWLIEVNSMVAGYGVLEHDFFDYDFVRMLYLAVDHRGAGLGTKLLVHLESICITSKLFTSTNESNQPARALLERAGFVRSGIIENLDDNDPELIYVKIMNGQ